MISQVSIVTSTTFYRVSGNMDQITKQGLDKGLEWKPDPRKHNRVSTELEMTEAVALYQKMKDLGMVAFRNWM